MKDRVLFGQPDAGEGVWAQLRDCVGQMRRASGRDAWLADLRCLPPALRWALPWAVLGRTSRDANPCRWLARQARRRRDVVAVSDPLRALTFEALLSESLETAAALQRRGITANDRVAILLPTGVDLVVTLLACWQLGAIPCPLDPGAPVAVLDQVRSQLGAALEIADYVGLRAKPQNPSTASASRPLSLKTPFWGLATASAHTPLHASAVAMILPTSGSEGYIKLCRITAGRLALSGHAFGGVALGCRRGDLIYCPLPLCHATAVTVGLMPALVHGVRLHLPGKFSASRCLQELHAMGATQLVYVGDLLRMVVAGADAPVSHRVRVAVGNGLDQVTFRRTVEWLKIPRIVEFYGATEAPRVLLNLSNRSGSCGRVPFRRLSRFLVVKKRVPGASDECGATNEVGSSASTTLSELVPRGRGESSGANETEPRAGATTSEQVPREPGESQRDSHPNAGADRAGWVHRGSRDDGGLRDPGIGPIAAAAGLGGAWTPCKPGEVGELWIRIPSRKRPWLGDFEGYLDRDHEHRVVLRDVFRPGDRFYRTYDLVRYDADDYFFFVERLGKVWRNRGHNVSTTWLTDELRLVNGIKDVSVFPVALDGSPRRFGLALVVTDDHERLRDALTNKIKSLPSYARPQLIQVVPSIPRTLTFKPTSAARNPGEPWEPTEVGSAFYLWDDGLRAIELAAWGATKRRLLAR